MIRFTVLPAALLVAACDRPAPGPEAPANAAASFDNAAAAQSIMQPEVVAANPPEPAATPTPEPSVPQPVTILFPRGAALDDAARTTLDGMKADWPADARLVLRGHSDSSGGDAANLTQSRRRAEVVRTYLVEQGIDAARIQVIALGERRPAAPNVNLDGSDDPAGRARNRRVTIEVLPAATPVTAPEPEAGPSTDRTAGDQ